MTDVGKWLKDADPSGHEPELSAAEAEALRRVTLAEMRVPAVRGATWPRLALAGAVALAAMGSVSMAQWWRAADKTAPARQQDGLPAALRSGDARQQLQFATPGGTRVIWVFDSAFQQ